MKISSFFVLLAAGTCLLSQSGLKAQDAQAYLDQGLDLTKSKKYLRAIECFQLALLEKPGFADAYYNMGKCQIVRNNYDKAILCYQKAVESEPKYSGDCYNNIGLCYELKRNFPLAIENYKKSSDAFSLNPSDKEKLQKVSFYLALNYTEVKDFSEAEEYYRVVLSLDPANESAWNNLAILYEGKGNYDKAIYLYEQAIARKPNYATAHYNLAVAYGKKGDKAKELEFFQKSAKMGNEKAKRWLEKNAPNSNN